MGNVPSRKVIRKNKDDNIPQEDSNIIPANLTGNGFCIRADSSVKIIGGRPYLDEEVSTYIDIGCGSGHWCFEVAQQFPEAEVYGVDIVSSFPNEIKPSNCYFQLCNVLEGLPFPNNEFDYVFMRHMIPALKKDQWVPLFDEIMRVLKPGGVVESVEFEWGAKSMGPVHTQLVTQ
ncbi:S-adenosyl-L-methionine-dependent methyltransferase [Gigaspora margarita]|uniref:S-adenosyl-L-methionine-dependent methyltransferase n=1 Tax=Gigaspora margarita TaxID=4874 RepID=A0A8H4AXW9_GIGMA|nr:S-adenosyl-L-methionine-dependent methyltransferase [Gigaspora margarita]